MTEIRLSRGGYASLHDSLGATDQPQASQAFPARPLLRGARFAPFVLAGNIAIATLAWFVVGVILH
jgi:hypothetical protein